MIHDVFTGILLPFIGTTVGAACVLFMRRAFGRTAERVLMGAAAGIMVAAGVWSLLLPAIAQSEYMGTLAFIPAVTGFGLGVGFLMLLDRVIPEPEGVLKLGNRRLMILAVTIHNIPEGMAVGAVYAGLIYGNADITAAAALALAAGIAIQNIPEGAIVSMPLRAAGMSRMTAFVYGTLSGAVEPVAAVLTVAAAGLLIPAMPYLLSFAAGAMMYVVVAELVPGMTADGKTAPGTVSFSVGFLLMMTLDIAFG
ncbi:MAG: ZIP family metal transporter [Ruminiclostridium sp.]|nr:ZIP family metal transporter [Ruminiclostridium sp.]